MFDRMNYICPATTAMREAAIKTVKLMKPVPPENFPPGWQDMEPFHLLWQCYESLRDQMCELQSTDCSDAFADTADDLARKQVQTTYNTFLDNPASK